MSGRRNECFRQARSTEVTLRVTRVPVGLKNALNQFLAITGNTVTPRHMQDFCIETDTPSLRIT